jgi:ribokinase
LVIMSERTRDTRSELLLTHALEKLRGRDGLTVARLAVANGNSEQLLSLPAVRKMIADGNVSPGAAARAVVRECVLGSLDGTHQIIADAVLALGLFGDQYVQRGIEQRVVDTLSQGLLLQRRECLLTHWRVLHEALDLVPLDPPSDRLLRGVTERLVLGELARQLLRDDGPGRRRAPAPTRAAGEPASGRKGRVVVIGAAVMDVTFRTKVLPQRDTSSEAHGFDLSPGGKGLTQAVAAARLGLDVSLIAAVARDRFGEEIVSYLQLEGVDTSLLKRVDDARTPFTGVFELEMGDSIAVNWRNEAEVRLGTRDVVNRADELTSCDAVLVTFEVPRDTVQLALSLAHGEPDVSPLVVVTPGQPYQNETLSGRALAQIDYLIAHAWELGPYGGSADDALDIDVVADRLIMYGVQTVCVPMGGGTRIYSQTPVGNFVVPAFPSRFKESSAARDAFCAALAASLIEREGEFSEEVALWSTAAMAAAIADYPLANSMPDRARIDHFLSRSRFTLAPRADKESGPR